MMTMEYSLSWYYEMVEVVLLMGALVCKQYNLTDKNQLLVLH